MSSDGQLKGDSLRRQLELSSRYAAEHGLTLVTDLNLADYGISAFKGQNAATGALGRFLEAVRSGKIAKGSYLLVESLDRLSRQNPRLALPQFLEIVNQDIVLVTLADQRKYTAESVRLEDLLYSLVVMSRAHEESQMKSQRIAAAWANKRSTAHQKKMTGRCPAWLRLSSDRKSFHQIADRVAVVKRIFDDAQSGIGGYAIARRLNADKVPAFVSLQGWHKSSVDKVLRSRAVLGECQPHRLVEGKRIAIGDPIQDYFPKIVSETTFDIAQAHRLSKRVGGGGRQGDRVSNLFSKIANCAYCRGTMRYENKGRGQKGGSYLTCDNAARGNGCLGGRWRYEDFEASFLAFVEEVDLGAIMDGEAEATARSALEARITSLSGGILQLEDERVNAYKLIEQPGINVEFVGDRLRACEAKLNELKSELHDAQREAGLNASSVSAFYESRDNISALVKGIAACEGRDGYKLRTEIAARLKSLIVSVEIGTLGFAPLRNPEDYKWISPEELALDNIGSFQVNFKGGTIRLVTPDENDPLKVKMWCYGPVRKEPKPKHRTKAERLMAARK